LGLALVNYEAQFGCFPGYSNRNATQQTNFNANGNPVSPYAAEVSWVVSILPFIDRSDLAVLWNQASAATISSGTFVGRRNLTLMSCPSAPPLYNSTMDTPLGYCVNGGMYEFDYSAGTAMPQPYGIFYNRGWESTPQPKNGGAPPAGAFTLKTPLPKISLDYISQHDGSSSTLLLSENVNQVLQGNGWSEMAPTGGGATSGNAYPPNREDLCFFWSGKAGTAQSSVMNVLNADLAAQQSVSHARPSSYHGGGVVATFCDGHQQFLKQDISITVYQQLCAPSDSIVGVAVDSQGNPTTPLSFGGSGSPAPPLSDADYR
jgi:prepilin-type processing-associated H-X9-DG protein